ncbi:MAG TPA: acylphosphatase [Planctomycetes bacterium]|nr:acylphosphatase [Planctomycetota bacterium]
MTKQVLFTGQVQGVGFRWTTSRIAAAYPVTGFVRNLADGRVELVVIGSEETTADMIRDVCDRFHGMIDSMVEEQIQLTETIIEFSIRH